jgi:hypothetical protein
MLMNVRKHTCSRRSPSHGAAHGDLGSCQWMRIEIRAIASGPSLEVTGGRAGKPTEDIPSWLLNGMPLLSTEQAIGALP